jgi:hypothetical protein
MSLSQLNPTCKHEFEKSVKGNETMRDMHKDYHNVELDLKTTKIRIEIGDSILNGMAEKIESN